MTTNPVEWCGASTRGYGPMPIGPCVLRHGHNGPLHRDESGVSWTDPRPASESSEPMCPSLDVANDNLRALLAEQRQRAEQAVRERDEAHEAWKAVQEESAALIAEYSEPAPDRENRCASCCQHETVDRKDAAARAMAKTARRYKRERDEARLVVQRVRDLHTPVPCECVKCNARRHEGLDDQLCAHCTDLLPQGNRDGGIRYPCPTITALDQPKESP